MNVNDNYSCEHHSLQLCPFHCHTMQYNYEFFLNDIYIYIPIDKLLLIAHRSQDGTPLLNSYTWVQLFRMAWAQCCGAWMVAYIGWI